MGNIPKRNMPKQIPRETVKEKSFIRNFIKISNPPQNNRPTIELKEETVALISFGHIEWRRLIWAFP